MPWRATCSETEGGPMYNDRSSFLGYNFYKSCVHFFINVYNQTTLLANC